MTKIETTCRLTFDSWTGKDLGVLMSVVMVVMMFGNLKH